MTLNKYNKVMSHVVMNDDMKSRILSGIESKTKAKKRNNVIRVMTAIAANAAVVAIAIIISMRNINNKPTDNTPTVDVSAVSKPDMDGDNVIPGVSTGPISKTFTTLEKLVKYSKIPIKELEYVPIKYNDKIYGTYGEVAYIDYNGKKAILTFGMYAGDGDKTGFQWDFTFEKSITINEKKVFVKGEGNKILVAIWKDGEYSKYITYEEGITEGQLKKIIK